MRGCVKPDPSRRIFIVGDPLDSATPFRFQRAFAEKLEQAGHSVTLVEGKAEGPRHHGLAHMARRAAGWCNAGQPTTQIVKEIKAGEYGLLVSAFASYGATSRIPTLWLYAENDGFFVPAASK